MDIIVISVLALVITALIIIIKELKADFAVLLSIAFSAVLFIYLIDPISKTITAFAGIAERSGISSDIFSAVLKVAGISFVAEFAASACSDAGQTAIASKVEAAGKIIIITLALPIITSMLDTIFSILP